MQATLFPSGDSFSCRGERSGPLGKLSPSSSSYSLPSLNLGFLTQYLREVANNVSPLPVHLSQDVKDEGLHVEVQCLVVQEKLGQQTQVLTVNLRGGSGGSSLRK